MIITRKIIHASGQHPVCLMALGITPLTMKCQTLLSGLTISLAFVLVLITASISVSGLRKFIPQHGHLVFILVITATWTTIVDLFLQARFYEMRILFDIYIPIVAMNSLLLMVLQRQALIIPVSGLVNKLLLTTGLVMMVCIFTGAIREILAQGVVLSDIELLFPSIPSAAVELIPESITLSLFNKVGGAFIVLGCFIALFNLVMQKFEIPIHENMNQL